MAQIASQIRKLLNEIPAGVTLVAVSKTKPNEDILEAYYAGHKIFGENKVQDLVVKAEELPKDIEWHFIGHLQTNKVKYIAHFIHLIHGVDSLKLLKEINKQGAKNNRVLSCLLQFHIASEDTKFGLDLDEAKELLTQFMANNFKYVKICGVMGMASYTDDHIQISQEFSQLKIYFDELKAAFFPEAPHFKEISMGMSGDYQLAIEQGSSMVRIGSTIFGLRSCAL